MRFPLLYLLFCSLAYSQNYHYALEDPKQNQPISLEGSYTLSEAARTSAGVYKGEVLVRTLWSNVEKEPGTHTVEWNGLDDEGNIAAKGNYEIKVVSNNVVYEWLSPIGNTSNTIGGGNIFNNAQVIQGMVQIDGEIYYNCGYNEHPPAFAKFSVDNINSDKPTIMANTHFGIQADHIATDGDIVYIAGTDVLNSDKNSLVFGINPTNDSQVAFSGGSEYILASVHKYASAFGIMPGNSTAITGMAVQKNGDYLFVARGELNQIYVYDKTTGGEELVINDLVNPREILVDGEYLWVINATNTVGKYSLNADGSINALVLSLTVPEPLTMAISNAGEIAVSDNSTQQVRFFNSSGTATGTLGNSGGYSTSPDVTDTKFMFINPSQPEMGTFLFYQDDGKLWVGDAGNYRSLRFNTNETLDDHIMYLCWTRSMGVDRNNPSRVFANYLEFDVDIEGGDWELVKNWTYNFDDTKDSEFHRLKWATTLSNGRTYAVQQIQVSPYNWELVELAEHGLRFTGIVLPRDGSMVLTEEGNLRRFYGVVVITGNRGPLYWKEQLLTGFDGSNNPIWDREEVIGSTGDLTPNDPPYRGTVGHNFPPRADTSTDLLISFEGGSSNPEYASNKYHLGATRKNGEGFLWKTAIGTNPDYSGDYPTDGSYDMGNGVQYPGGIILVKEHSIFWNYHGEFWKDMQTNKFQHVLDNGLLLGVFGVAGNEIIDGKRVWDQKGVPEMAGNNIKGDIVKINNDYYILHGDEGHHGAIHRWKVSGLDSIKEHTIIVHF